MTDSARTINLPDTLGCALPEQVTELFMDLYARVPELGEVTVSFHGHNDLGLATANGLAAVKAGARQLELTVNGIGERAGNGSLEEVAILLQAHGESLGVHTGIDAKALWAMSQLVEKRSGLPVSPHKAIVGRNVFRHAAQAHQDGVLKLLQSHGMVDPEKLGHPEADDLQIQSEPPDAEAWPGPGV